MTRRIRLQLTDDRYKGLRTHTKNTVAICPAIRTITTGWLWWREKKIDTVYAVMLAVEDSSFNATLMQSFTDYHWKLVDSFESYEMAVNLKEKLLFNEDPVDNKSE